MMITMRTINAAADDNEVDTNMMKTITNIILFQNNNVDTPDGAPQREIKFKKVGSLDDRSKLSDEMADVCKKLPSS